MKRVILICFLFLVSYFPALAEIQVPVTYDLGVKDASPIVGFITGGSFMEPEGIRVLPENASETVVFDYLDIDKIASLSLSGDTLEMQITFKDGETTKATTKISDTAPLIVLRDEIASGNSFSLGKERVFTKANFKGISSIDFETDLTDEEKIETLKDLSTKMTQAIESKDFAKAVEFNVQIGEILADLQNSQISSESFPAPVK